MSEVDVMENPYQCAVCDQRFPEKSAREKHYFSHANMVGRCRVCGFYCIKGTIHCKSKTQKHLGNPSPPSSSQTHLGNPSPSSTQTHLRNPSPSSSTQTHLRNPLPSSSWQKPKFLKCPKCRIYFKSESERAEHKQAIHNPKNSCDLCDKSFSTKRGLILHLRLHLNIKPYVCHICNKAFTWDTILRDHILTHSNVKAFACEFCNRPFKLKKGLKKHYITHTQEKPYMCETCGRCFSALGNLKTHYRTHNKLKKEPVTL